MPGDRPPHPGARPSDLHFPFDEARRAATETRALASDLRDLARVLAADLGDLAGTAFEGIFADWLLTAGNDAEQELRQRAGRLDDQAEQIEAATVHARNRVSERQDQVMRYEQRHRRWRDWEEPVGADRP